VGNQPSIAEYEASVGEPAVALLGCAAAADEVACLRALPSATIVKTIPGVGGIKNEGSTYKPVVDGYVLEETVLRTAKEGQHNHVPLIIGTTDNEASGPAFTPVNAIPTDAAYQNAIYDLFGQTVGDQVLARYPAAAYSSPRAAYAAATTDYRWVCPARQVAQAVSKSQEQPVYKFLYTHAQSNPPAVTALGAWHGEELMFIFHSFTSGVSGPFTPTAAELALSDQIIGYWSRFAASGNPNAGGAVTWSPFGRNADDQGDTDEVLAGDAHGNAKKEAFLQLDVPISAGAGYHAEVCATFWDVLARDTNSRHGEGRDSAADEPADENAGNEPFLTYADLDNE
jgi:para-nitrobenzyl esterase